jgi:hypothetical protein
VSTKVVDEPLGETVNAIAVPSHASPNALGPAVTGSLNVIVIVVDVGTSPAPFGGVVATTNGGWSPTHVFRGESVLRGSGDRATKSVEFTSVSWQPRGAGAGGFLKSAVVFESPGAGPGAGVVSQQSAAP